MKGIKKYLIVFVLGFIIGILTMHIDLEIFDIRDFASIFGSMIGSFIAVLGAFLTINYQFGKQSRLQYDKESKSAREKLLSDLIKSKVILERINYHFKIQKTNFWFAADDERKRLYVNQVFKSLSELYHGGKVTCDEELNEGIYQFKEDLLLYGSYLTEDETSKINQLLLNYRDYFGYMEVIKQDGNKLIENGGTVTTQKKSDNGKIVTGSELNILDIEDSVVDKTISNFNDLFNYVEMVKQR